MGATDIDLRRISDTRAYVYASDLPDTEKDALSGLLDHAQRISNGAADKVDNIAAAMRDYFVYAARRDVREQKRLHEAIECHRKRCRDWKSDALKAVMATCGVLVVWMLRGMVMG